MENHLVIHPAVVELFHSGPTWWTDMVIPRVRLLAWLKTSCKQIFELYFALRGDITDIMKLNLLLSSMDLKKRN